MTAGEGLEGKHGSAVSTVDGSSGNGRCRGCCFSSAQQGMHGKPPADVEHAISKSLHSRTAGQRQLIPTSQPGAPAVAAQPSCTMRGSPCSNDREAARCSGRLAHVGLLWPAVAPMAAPAFKRGMPGRKLPSCKLHTAACPAAGASEPCCLACNSWQCGDAR